MRKDVADLLRNGKQEHARIRVEGVLREQLLLQARGHPGARTHFPGRQPATLGRPTTLGAPWCAAWCAAWCPVQAYEILELYLELLAVRSQLVAKNKEIPRDMVEGVSSLVYAAQVRRACACSTRGAGHAGRTGRHAIRARSQRRWRSPALPLATRPASRCTRLNLVLGARGSWRQRAARRHVHRSVQIAPPAATVTHAQRISDVPELQSLRKLLAAKYGDEYVREASGDVTCTRWQVNAALIRCLLVSLLHQGGRRGALAPAGRRGSVPPPQSLPPPVTLLADRWSRRSQRTGCRLCPTLPRSTAWSGTSTRPPATSCRRPPPRHLLPWQRLLLILTIPPRSTRPRLRRHRWAASWTRTRQRRRLRRLRRTRGPWLSGPPAWRRARRAALLLTQRLTRGPRRR